MRGEGQHAQSSQRLSQKERTEGMEGEGVKIGSVSKRARAEGIWVTWNAQSLFGTPHFSLLSLPHVLTLKGTRSRAESHDVWISANR